MYEVYELTTRYDARKSFYGKARVEETDTDLTLISYNTRVCRIDKKTNKVVEFGLYSNTTLRHIKEFLKQNGFKAENQTQMCKDYGELES